MVVKIGFDTEENGPFEVGDRKKGSQGDEQNSPQYRSDTTPGTLCTRTQPTRRRTRPRRTNRISNWPEVSRSLPIVAKEKEKHGKTASHVDFVQSPASPRLRSPSVPVAADRGAAPRLRRGPRRGGDIFQHAARGPAPQPGKLIRGLRRTILSE